jgi:uncharacterized cupin superfamily protein
MYILPTDICKQTNNYYYYHTAIQRKSSDVKSTIFIIPEKEADVIESDISGWKKVDGEHEPTMKTWIEYATKVALCGTWEATVGTYRECFVQITRIDL